GVAILLDHAGVVNLPPFSVLWPVFPMVAGIGHLTEGRPAAALMMILISLWCFSCEFHWYGFTFANSWPVAVIAAGLGIVVGAMTGEESRYRQRLRREVGHD